MDHHLEAGRSPRRSHCPESGVALILGVLFTIIVFGLVVSGTLLMKAHRTKTETSFRVYGQATQFSRAGLIEAMGWFRKSPTQPVTVFQPVLNTGVSPAVLETNDPDVGLMREFQINGPIWGRYEVWKQWDTDPDPVRLAWRQKMQAEDITTRVGASGAGNVWKIQSVGYVFRQMDPSVPFDQYPNQVLGTDILASEVRRLTLAPPGQSAICSRAAQLTTINNRVNIQAGLTANSVYSSASASTGGVNIIGSPTIVGPRSTSSSYDDSVEAVFGVSEKDLQVLADDYITSQAAFPSPVAASSLYYVEVPQLDITPARPLNGTAVIYVKGDVVFAYNSKSFFTGMLYVNGDLTIREPCEINGTIICTGNVTIWGQSDWININYDDEALNNLRTAIGQYRLSAAIRKILSSE